jgi:hypothetical protein
VNRLGLGSHCYVPLEIAAKTLAGSIC